MRGVDNEHCVEFESDRARLNIPNTRELERREDFAIRGAALDLCAHFLEQAISRTVLEQSHERLDLWTESHEVRICCRLGGGDGRQSTQKCQLREANGGARASRSLKEG